MVLDYGTRHSFGVFFKPMQTEFDWSRALTSGAFTVSMIVQGVCGVFMGRLNDKLGPRVVMTSCGFFLGLGYILLSQINSGWQLYLFYGLLVGIGMGGVFVSLLSTVARWFVKRRGAMTGIVSAGMSMGRFIMPPVLNFLIAVYEWRIAYAIIGGVIILLGITAAQFLKRDPSKVGLVPYGQNETGTGNTPSVITGKTLRQAAATGKFWMLAFIFFCLGYDIFSFIVHLVPYATDLGISSATAASMLAVTGVLGIMSSVVLGNAIDKIGSKWVCIITFSMILITLIGIVNVTKTWMLYLFTVSYGLGGGGGAITESTLSAELFGMKSHGVILGFLSFVFTIGGALGPFLTGYIFDITGSYRMAFYLCGVVAFIAIILVASLRTGNPSKAST